MQSKKGRQQFLSLAFLGRWVIKAFLFWYLIMNASVRMAHLSNCLSKNEHLFIIYTYHSYTCPLKPAEHKRYSEEY